LSLLKFFSSLCLIESSRSQSFSPSAREGHPLLFSFYLKNFREAKQKVLSWGAPKGLVADKPIGKLTVSESIGCLSRFCLAFRFVLVRSLIDRYDDFCFSF